jgi:hypothetical protein
LSLLGLINTMREPRGTSWGRRLVDRVPLRSQFRGWRKRERGNGRLPVAE